MVVVLLFVIQSLRQPFQMLADWLALKQAPASMDIGIVHNPLMQVAKCGRVGRRPRMLASTHSAISFLWLRLSIPPW